MKIKTLIVEDESVARRRIKRLLAGDSEIEIVGEAANGQAAVALLRQEKPDLLFLDIQMPGIDGFGVLEKIAGQELPTIIFTTAYDHHAVRAFEFEALDYLLKPFDGERFEKTLARAKKQIRSKQNVDLSRLASVIHSLKPATEYLERAVIKTAGDILILKTVEIDWIEAMGDYMKLHVGKDTHLLRETMNELEKKLNPKTFLRIQRSVIINVEQIKKMNPLFRGTYVITLQNGTQLTSSRNYRQRLSDLLGAAL